MCWLVYNVFFYLYKFLLMLVVIMNKFTLLFLEGRIDFTLKMLTKSELMGRMLSLVLSNFVIALTTSINAWDPTPAVSSPLPWLHGKPIKSVRTY